MNHGSLFSGIGGFDLAAEWAGWNNVFHCEINPFGQKILKYYWPNAVLYEDITKTDFSVWRGRIDILTGGFPCQPFSMAGKRKGTEDSRHLWPEMLRVIREVQPTWVVGENVSGLVNWDGGVVFEQVQVDLETEGYEVIPFILPACAVNAPHRRDRVWFVAYSEGIGNRGKLRRLEESYGQFGKSEECWQGNHELRNDGSEWSSPDPNINGCDRGNCEHEIIPGQGGFDALGHPVKVCERTTSNPTGIRLCVNGSGQRLQPSTLGTQHGVDEKFAPDTTGIRLQGRKECGSVRESEGTSRREGGESSMRVETDGCLRDAPDPRNEGLQGSKINGSAGGCREERNKQFAGFLRPGWENFPTQSPVCQRNDGISDRLDGITFSKWRIESIKAYGNAIVPQVVYQIFKSINKWKQSLN